MPAVTIKISDSGGEVCMTIEMDKAYAQSKSPTDLTPAQQVGLLVADYARRLMEGGATEKRTRQFDHDGREILTPKLPKAPIDVDW